MEILFLGTGGGRFNLLKQKRKTGGFRIDYGKIIHVDPGPGALINLKQAKKDVFETNGLIISHNHIDHTNDANLIIEGMTRYGFEKKGFIISSKECLYGDISGDKAVSTYHLNKIKNVFEVKRDKKQRQIEDIKIRTIKTIHRDKNSGFAICLDIGKKIGYTGDTFYFDELKEFFSDVDVLIANTLKFKEDKIKNHLSVESLVKIVENTGIKTVILTHIGMEMQRMEGKEIKKQIADLGIETILADDLQTYSF